MDLHQLQSAFRTSPAIQLMRSPNAPFLLDFLHSQFKAVQKLTIPDDELRGALRDYRESVREFDPEALPDTPAAYLTKWCERGFLHRFYHQGSTGGEATFQLTSHTESVLNFLDRMISNEVGFVGTESRVRLVMESLKELAVESSDDAEERIRHLQAEKTGIEEEIARIERDGTVQRLSEVEIRDRFGVIIDLLKQVQGDFRHVEESFKEITRELQRRQLGESAGRGELIGYALEAEEMLRQEDQGESFEAFTRLILSPDRQEEFYAMIERVTDLVELATQRAGLARLRGTPAQLLAEAQKVMATTQRLSGSLRLLLDDRVSEDHRRIRRLLAEIRELAAETSSAPPPDGAIGLEFDPGLSPFRSPITREFFKPPETIEVVTIHDGVEDPEARDEVFRKYAAMARLDWDGMRDKIRKATAKGQQETLVALLDKYPPKSGAIEVVGYIRLAREENHLVHRDRKETLILPGGRKLTVPRVVFLPPQTLATTCA